MFSYGKIKRNVSGYLSGHDMKQSHSDNFALAISEAITLDGSRWLDEGKFNEASLRGEIRIACTCMHQKGLWHWVYFCFILVGVCLLISQYIFSFAFQIG